MLTLNNTQLIDDTVIEQPHSVAHGNYEIKPLTFSYEPEIPTEGQIVHFEAPAANYAVTYSWNFGDGTSQDTTEPEVNHIYPVTGEYDVTLTCTTENLTATVTKILNIGYPYNPTIDVALDVGSIHFGGEIAEFNLLTSNYGEAVNATQIEAHLYHNGALQADLTTSIQHIDIGYYAIPYNIPVDAEAGTYTLILKAQYYNARGINMKSFQISQTLTGSITNIENGIVTILTDLSYVKMNLTAINAQLVNVDGNLATIQTAIGMLHTDVSTINATLTDIQGTIAIIDSEIGGLQTDISNINATLISVEGDIATIDSTLGQIQTDINNLDDGINTIDDGMGEFETKLEEIHGTANTTLYAASIISAIAAILAAIILIMRFRKG
jgi:PKD repeat protein